MKVRRAKCSVISGETREQWLGVVEGLALFAGLLCMVPWWTLCALGGAARDAGRALLRCRWITPLLPRKFERARQRRCANNEEGCHD